MPDTAKHLRLVSEIDRAAIEAVERWRVLLSDLETVSRRSRWDLSSIRAHVDAGDYDRARYAVDWLLSEYRPERT
jgi:hypothetical protein